MEFSFNLFVVCCLFPKAFFLRFIHINYGFDIPNIKGLCLLVSHKVFKVFPHMSLYVKQVIPGAGPFYLSART